MLLTALPTSVAAQPTPELVVANGLGVVAPDPGVGVAVTAVMVDGRSLDLVVETDLDGVTRVVGHATGTAALTDGVTAGKDACADGKHAEIGFRWTTPWRWRFRASSTPDGMAKATAEQQLRSAVRSITTARNDCGLPDRVSAKAVYLGRTSSKPGVRTNATCGRTDGSNVVGFGTLPMFIAGVTCTVYTVPGRGWGHATESDGPPGWPRAAATRSSSDRSRPMSSATSLAWATCARPATPT